ncbi:MAG: UDPglucose 6-dehydrogenase [Patescibacteria group bacterium]|nr:UDPglucose 6-dehydrogenase [Patescibacteria group bacterium]
MKAQNKKPTIGFIGQGWIGKNYSDDLERRGYDVVRFSLEKEYVGNKQKIAFCDIVFIAVPTPTTPKGFDDSLLRAVLPLVGKGKIAVIKSTLVLGKTEQLQSAFPSIFVLHSPEFLSERTAAYDAQHPTRNIIGLPKQTPKFKACANRVMSVLPKAEYSLICSSIEAEFIKYSHNVNGYIQVVLSNVLYDIADKSGMKWDTLKSAFNADPMMSHRYLNPFDTKKGRGAGGHCFIKDFEAFIEIAKKSRIKGVSIKMLEAIRNSNVELLVSSGKDIELVKGVYDKKFLSKLRS